MLRAVNPKGRQPLTDDDRPQQPPQRGSQYGNFKEEPGERKKHVSSQKRREGNNKAYLELIRQLPCIIPGCTRGPRVDPHHLKGGPAKQERALGRRSTDKWAVPMCRQHHDMLPVNAADEPPWFMEMGVPRVYDLARALCTAVRDLGMMRRLVRDHQEP